MSNEQAIFDKFKEQIQSETRLLQTEVPIGELTADGRLVEINSGTKVVKSVVAYVEAKGEDADLRDLLTGLGQCAYYVEQSGCPAWLVLSHGQVQRLLGSDKKIDPRINLYDVDEGKLILTEQLTERASKSRLKRSQERVMFKPWEREFTIVTQSPLVLVTPRFDKDGQVILNVGQRIRGVLKLAAQTISGTLAESCKFSIYVEPLDVVIANKGELVFMSKYMPDSSGRGSKREYYEVPCPRKITFKVRCINQKLTPEVVENLLRQGGMFCGIGDSHMDGYHGRYVLQE